MNSNRLKLMKHQMERLLLDEELIFWYNYTTYKHWIQLQNINYSKTSLYEHLTGRFVLEMCLANKDSSYVRAMGICSEFSNQYTVVLWIGAHLYISNCAVSDRKSINSCVIWHYCIKSLKNDVASFSYTYQEDHIGW